MKRTWLIDAGHGGLDASGHYTTDPKIGKLFKHPQFTIYEGVINRQIAHKVWKQLEEAKISFKLVYDEVEDWGLVKRVNIANALHAKLHNCVYLSIHSNAGKGKGIEVWTSKGQTSSDPIAQIFADVYRKFFPEFPLREDKSDADSDKEQDFYVVKHTSCPAVLVENLFFDEIKQAEFLRSELGQERIANAIVYAIKLIEAQ